MKFQSLTRTALALAFVASMPVAFAEEESALPPPAPAAGAAQEAPKAPSAELEKKSDKKLSKHEKKHGKKSGKVESKKQDTSMK